MLIRRKAFLAQCCFPMGSLEGLGGEGEDGVRYIVSFAFGRFLSHCGEMDLICWFWISEAEGKT